MCLGFPGDMSPRFPPSKRAEELKTVLQYVLVAHVIVTVVKIILGGLNAGTGDIFNVLILWCGYTQFDYCNTITYMIMCLQDACTLGVSLGFWFQKKYIVPEGQVTDKQMQS